MENRFKLQQMLDGVRASLVSESDKLSAMYADTTSTMEAREKQALLVKDLEERERGINAQIEAIDKQAADNMKKNPIVMSDKDKIINAKAGLIRAVMTGKPVSNEILAVLSDGANGLQGGQKILPTTMTTQLVTEPMSKNPLRNISTVTNITNLEVPKILFSLDDDDFLNTDTETAKEMKAEADIISFDRNKFKVFCDIPETVLNGTTTNLVATVDAALESGLAKKEKKVAFATSSPTPMSFYYKDIDNPNTSGSSDYVIKKCTGASMFEAIISALGDLEDDYAENAKIVMRKTDYFKVIKELSNGSVALYAAQPEQVLGAPVVFCDLATIPVVGDFAYSHFNYDENMLYDRDKNVKTGVESFVLTAWLDHKIKMKSAFRLAEKVTP